MKKVENKTDNRKSNIVLALMFAGILLGGAINCQIGIKTKQQEQEIANQIYGDYSLISAKIVSDVRKEKKENIVSYFIDVDFNDDGEKDKTIKLVDNVKYVSEKRNKKIAKLKNNSKIIIEGDIKTHIEIINAPINVDGKTIMTPWPKNIVDSISGTSAVGLIDNILVVDGEVTGETKNKSNQEQIDYFDMAGKYGYIDEFLGEPKDGKMEEKAFENLYISYLRGR